MIWEATQPQPYVNAHCSFVTVELTLRVEQGKFAS